MDLGGVTTLERCLARASRSLAIGRLVVATTSLKEDDAIEQLCVSIGVDCFRGAEQDVLGRYYDCARQLGAEVIVRLTGDNPLVEPTVIDRVVGLFGTGAYDYVCNRRPRTFPLGFDVECFSMEALATAWREDRDCWTREHVTPFIVENSHRFRLGVVLACNGADYSNFRLTVDTLEDYRLVSEVYARPELLDDWHRIVEFLEANPSIARLNQHVRQVQVPTRKV